MRRVRGILPVAAIVVVGLVALWPAIGNGTHLDDQYRIVENLELEHVWPPWRHFVDPSTSSTLPTIVQYRPMLPLSLSITAWLGDALSLPREVAHRVGNLALHLVAAWLTMVLVRSLAAQRQPVARAHELGVWAGLLYAAHPVAGVPVNYLCARDLLMMQAALLGSLCMFVRLRVRGPTPTRWAAALGLLTLSLTAKTDAVVAPALVGAIDFTVFGTSLRDRKWWARVAAYSVPVVAFFVATELVLDFSDADQLLVARPWWEYPLTQARLHVAYYLRNAVWPFAMRPLPAIQPATGLSDVGALVGLVVIAGSIALAWRWRQRAPLAATCVVLYWIAFAPTSWFLPFRYLATDYRQVPSLPWLCALAASAGLAVGRRMQARAALAVVVAYLVAASVLLDLVWKDERTLWGHAVRHGTAPQGHVNFARAIAAEDPERARAHYEHALARAPDNVFAQINLGMLDVYEGHHADGVARLQAAAAAAPQWTWTATWLRRGCETAAVSAPATPADAAAQDRCRAWLETDPSPSPPP